MPTSRRRGAASCRSRSPTRARHSCTPYGVLIDLGGQRVSATDRLYLAGELPTLIVWGEHDPLIPVSHAHEAHASIPGSRLEIFPGAGHFPYRHDPRRFAATLLDFVQTTTPMPVDEQRWLRRLRIGVQSTAAP